MMMIKIYGKKREICCIVHYSFIIIILLKLISGLIRKIDIIILYPYKQVIKILILHLSINFLLNYSNYKTIENNKKKCLEQLKQQRKYLKGDHFI